MALRSDTRVKRLEKHFEATVAIPPGYVMITRYMDLIYGDGELGEPGEDRLVRWADIEAVLDQVYGDYDPPPGVA